MRKELGEIWQKLPDDHKKRFMQTADDENRKRKDEWARQRLAHVVRVWEEDDARRRDLSGAGAGGMSRFRQPRDAFLEEFDEQMEILFPDARA